MICTWLRNWKESTLDDGEEGYLMFDVIVGGEDLNFLCFPIIHIFNHSDGCQGSGRFELFDRRR